MPRKNKKICLFINSLYGGGAEKVLQLHSNELVKRGYDVDVITLEIDSFYKLDKRVNRINLSSLDYKSARLFKVLYFLIFYFKLKRICKKNNYDYLFSYMEIPNIISTFVKITTKLKTRFLVSIHVNPSSYYIKGFYGIFFRNMIKKCYPKSDKIVVVSNEIKKTLIEEYEISQEKISVLYNPIDLNRIEKISNQKISLNDEKIFENSKVFVNVGRLNIQKGHKYMIKAFSIVRNKREGLKLIIIGHGELENELKALVKDLNLQKEVFILGSRKNVFKYLERSHVFLFPSLWEGFGIVLVEALSVGIPIIASDCKSGPREILFQNREISRKVKYPKRSEFGSLIDVPSLENEVKIINQLAKEMLFYIDRGINKANIKRGAQRFSIEKIVDELEEILK